MSHFVQLETTREFVHTTLEQLEGESLNDVQETILICDGFYCGRRFCSTSYHAVWFVEENELKFYGPDGIIVRETTVTNSYLPPLRRAA